MDRIRYGTLNVAEIIFFGILDIKQKVATICTLYFEINFLSGKLSIEILW